MRYTQAEISEKARILKEAGFTKEERRTLMERGVVGEDNKGDEEVLPESLEDIVVSSAQEEQSRSELKFTGFTLDGSQIRVDATTKVTLENIDTLLEPLYNPLTDQSLRDPVTNRQYKRFKGVVDVENEKAYVWEKPLDVHHTMVAASILEYEGKDDLATKLRRAEFDRNVQSEGYSRYVLERFQGFEFTYGPEFGVYNFNVRSKLTTQQSKQKIKLKMKKLLKTRLIELILLYLMKFLNYSHKN